jgi:hypothetical protein
MRTMTILAAAGAMLAAGSASAQKAAPSCKLQAGDKKLAGAALTSFMKKCEGDATATCNKSADDKKLAGAARASYTKKCIADATGS